MSARRTHVDVERLRLADEWRAVNGELEHLLLRNLPHSLVQEFEFRLQQQ